MRTLLLPTAALVLLLPSAVLAQTQVETHTRTIDNPRVQGSTTVTRDRAAGTNSRETNLTRTSDGATASRSQTVQRGESGYTSSGTTTTFAGETFTSTGSGMRTDDGFVRSQTVVDSTGQTVLDRQVSVTTIDGVRHREVTTDRAEGFRGRRPDQGNRQRPRPGRGG